MNTKPTTAQSDKQKAKQDKRAAALRENLKKRKARAAPHNKQTTRDQE